MTNQHPLTDELQQQIDAEEAWEKQHPLTDEICHQITWAVRYKTSDENDMRAAADWQLEEVIEWLRENLHLIEEDGYPRYLKNTTYEECAVIDAWKLIDALKSNASTSCRSSTSLL